MSGREDARGGSIRRRLLTAFAAVAVPPVLLLAALVLVLLSRSFERTAESRLRDGIAAVEGRLARMETVARVKVAAVAREDLPVAADADLPGLATESGERRDLAVLEIVGADGKILSSLHWPVSCCCLCLLPRFERTRHRPLACQLTLRSVSCTRSCAYGCA